MDRKKTLDLKDDLRNVRDNLPEDRRPRHARRYDLDDDDDDLLYEYEAAFGGLCGWTGGEGDW